MKTRYSTAVDIKKMRRGKQVRLLQAVILQCVKDFQIAYCTCTVYRILNMRHNSNCQVLESASENNDLNILDNHCSIKILNYHV